MSDARVPSDTPEDAHEDGRQYLEASATLLMRELADARAQRDAAVARAEGLEIALQAERSFNLGITEECRAAVSRADSAEAAAGAMREAFHVRENVELQDALIAAEDERDAARRWSAAWKRLATRQRVTGATVQRYTRALDNANAEIDKLSQSDGEQRMRRVEAEQEVARLTARVAELERKPPTVDHAPNGYPICMKCGKPNFILVERGDLWVCGRCRSAHDRQVAGDRRDWDALEAMDVDPPANEDEERSEG